MDIHHKKSVGEPELLESLIPIWGSGRESINHFQHGNYTKGLLWGAMAVTDVFLVKTIVTGGIKLVGRAGASYMLKESRTVAVKASINTLKTEAANAGRIIEKTVDSVVKVSDTAKKMVQHAAKGPWRPFGHTYKLVKGKKIQYKFGNIFWDTRKFKAVSAQYWRINKANGNSLQHLWIQNQTKLPKMFEGLRNSGINLLEVPKGLNSWMGGIALREQMFRGGVGLTLIGTYSTAYYGAKSLIAWMIDEDENHHTDVKKKSKDGNLPPK